MHMLFPKRSRIHLPLTCLSIVMASASGLVGCDLDEVEEFDEFDEFDEFELEFEADEVLDAQPELDDDHELPVVNITPQAADLQDEIAAPEGPEAKPALNQGSSTTSFDPVVRIETTYSNKTSYCTATAIADDMLVTAAHCVKSGNEVAKYTKVRKAHGVNNHRQGEHSSYFILSEDIYDNYKVEDSVPASFYSRDVAFVKFASGTFDAHYDVTAITSTGALNGDTVTMLGFGGNDTKHYGVDTITGVYESNANNDYMYALADNSNGVANLESGDSGGPLLRAVGNSYELVGVASAASEDHSIHTVVTDHIWNHVSDVLDNQLDKYCFDAWQHADYLGDGFAFCSKDLINAQFANDNAFEDTYKIAWHDRNSKWKDRISSLEVPDNMIVTLFSGSNTTGRSTTYQQLLPMGASEGSSDLSWDGINDAVSSVWLTYTTGSGLGKDYYIESTFEGDCMAIAGSTANGTPIEEVTCVEGDSDQLFEFVHSGGSYKIRHAASGKCVQRSAWQLELQACDGGSDQLYDFTDQDMSSRTNDFEILGQGGECIERNLFGGFKTGFCSPASAMHQTFVIRYR